MKRLSQNETILLRLLVDNDKDMYGLELFNAAENKIRRGSLHTVLSSMENKGYIRSRKEKIPDSNTRGPVRLYSHTESGKQMLRANDVFNADIASIFNRG